MSSRRLEGRIDGPGLVFLTHRLLATGADATEAELDLRNSLVKLLSPKAKKVWEKKLAASPKHRAVEKLTLKSALVGVGSKASKAAKKGRPMRAKRGATRLTTKVVSKGR